MLSFCRSLLVPKNLRKFQVVRERPLVKNLYDHGPRSDLVLTATESSSFVPPILQVDATVLNLLLIVQYGM